MGIIRGKAWWDNVGNGKWFAITVFNRSNGQRTEVKSKTFKEKEKASSSLSLESERSSLAVLVSKWLLICSYYTYDEQ